MKISRLLGETIYLLNHGRTSAQFLAQHFEVSTRTIMRDIDTLCMAGIPVVSSYGTDGGYELIVPENEQFWYGVILSFGKKAKVISPIEHVNRIKENCMDIMQMYLESDI